MIITVVGPIDYWWNNNWRTPEHLAYMKWRDAVCKALVNAGHLVYRPHEAFKGAWNERAQRVNNMAIGMSDLIICVRPEGVPAFGTEAEIEFANRLKIPVLYAPPNVWSNIESFVKPLSDPYEGVKQRSTVTQSNI